MKFLNPVGLIVVAMLVAAMWMDRPIDIGVRRVSAPIHPLHTDRGGVVIAEIRTIPSGQGISTTLLAGELPFSSSALNALMRWEFEDASSDRTTSVTFLFRPRSFHRVEPIEPVVGLVGRQDSPATPLRITDPGYRLGISQRGSVILEVALSAEGRITDVEIVLGIEQLTELALNEISNWTFSPAIVHGEPRPSKAFVVISFVNPLA